MGVSNPLCIVCALFVRPVPTALASSVCSPRVSTHASLRGWCRGFSLSSPTGVRVAFLKRSDDVPRVERKAMSIPSFHTVVVVAGASLFAASQSASAAIISFTQQFVWEFYVTNAGAAISVETFDSYSGFYPGSLTGSSGGVDWTATAAGGIFVGVAAGSPALSTNNVAPLTISFAGAPLRGVGGNFFGTDVNFNVVPAIVQLALDNGSSYVALIDSAASFAGFYSTDALITSITILAQPAPGGSSDVYPTADNLRFAVIPAPGALALLAAAGFVGFRRRR